jgi:hypothetical protein
VIEEHPPEANTVRAIRRATPGDPVVLLSIRSSRDFDPINVFGSVGRKFVAWHEVSGWRWRVRNAPAVEGP